MPPRSKKSQASKGTHHLSVRVIKGSERSKSHQAKHFSPPKRNRKREKLLWRLVIIVAVVIVVFWAFILQANLSSRSSGDSLWRTIRSQLATVGEEFDDLLRSITGSQTIRPEDEYSELEEAVFPPLPASAESE
ncbi:MAG: hypothetical protein V1838_03410 [Patescibacteria group bacterium]